MFTLCLTYIVFCYPAKNSTNHIKVNHVYLLFYPPETVSVCASIYLFLQPGTCRDFADLFLMCVWGCWFGLVFMHAERDTCLCKCTLWTRVQQWVFTVQVVQDIIIYQSFLSDHNLYIDLIIRSNLLHSCEYTSLSWPHTFALQLVEKACVFDSFKLIIKTERKNMKLIIFVQNHIAILSSWRRITSFAYGITNFHKTVF